MDTSICVSDIAKIIDSDTNSDIEKKSKKKSSKNNGNFPKEDENDFLKINLHQINQSDDESSAMEYPFH